VSVDTDAGTAVMEPESPSTMSTTNSNRRAGWSARNRPPTSAARSAE
jgi:hypothetical protein